MFLLRHQGPITCFFCPLFYCSHTKYTELIQTRSIQYMKSLGLAALVLAVIVPFP